MTIDDIKGEISRLNLHPQTAHLANVALDGISSLLTELSKLGHDFSLVRTEASDYVAKQWPQWVDGKLFKSQAEVDAAKPVVDSADPPPPIIPLEPHVVSTSPGTVVDPVKPGVGGSAKPSPAPVIPPEKKD